MMFAVTPAPTRLMISTLGAVKVAPLPLKSKGSKVKVESLKGAGFGDLEVYSPVPSHEIEHAVGKGPSRVRLWTLLGGLAGVCSGYLMTIWMAYDWPLVIGGKPFASIPAYTIIAFDHVEEQFNRLRAGNHSSASFGH